MIVRQSGELKVRSLSDREAAALRADLDFAGLPKPRSAVRFEGGSLFPGDYGRSFWGVKCGGVPENQIND